MRLLKFIGWFLLSIIILACCITLAILIVSSVNGDTFVVTATNWIESIKAWLSLGLIQIRI